MIARLVSAPKLSNRPENEALLASAKALLVTSFRLQNEGARAEKLSEARALADGYMRALCESGLVTERELLGLVQEARRGVSGPSVRAFERDEDFGVAV